jgi:UDP-glucose:(heptosyl)LPS alpha-1,3-glucosyltransferase
VEAIVAGLPVLVTDVCGYAKHVTKADAGLVVPSPFNQHNFGSQLTEMLQTDLKECAHNGLEYSKSEDLYSMPEKVVKIIEGMVKRNSKESGD